ncbi:hypothetical protein Q5N30_18605, partial [Vibrio cholerae]|uniref:hypothetical protein n=1 Tax=Vibrio cholerae TaxID=666 RepID=UPI0029343619
LKVPSSFTETGLLTPLMMTDTDVPLKSTFLVALSPDNVKVTLLSVVLALLNVTSNVAVSPSATSELLMLDTLGRSSSAVPPGPGGVTLPSSVIVALAEFAVVDTLAS